MYQRFKDCLFRPRNIADYINEPKKKTIIYTSILLVVYVIPFILLALLSNTIVTNLSSSASDDFINAPQINYTISGGKLVNINDDNKPQYIETKIILDQSYQLNALYVFDLTGDAYKEILEVEPSEYIVMLFTENEFKISKIQVTKKENNNNNPGITVGLFDSVNKKDERNIISYTYEELGIENINLAGNKDFNSINFKNDIAKFVTALYQKTKNRFLVLIIIIVLLIAVSSYFLSVLFISGLFKLLYRYLQVDFNRIFKATILCSTPYVICSILAIFTNIMFLEVVGQFIMIAYLTKVLTTYKIKYDGGVPLPRFMQNIMNDRKDEEKGSGDDEL